MELIFDHGYSEQPRGHALVYFRDSFYSDKIYATYVVVFPLPVNMSKYVPPFLTSSLGAGSLENISSFPMPPVPEEVENYSILTQLAQIRDDDLIYGGTITSSDVASTMLNINEIAQCYTEMCAEYKTSKNPPQVESDQGEIGVNEVMFSLLSEKDRLNELSNLVVKFRFAMESRDDEMQREIADQIKTLSRYLPEDYKIDKLIEVGMDASARGTRLAQLYLDRCYSLSEGNKDKVKHLDQEIEPLEASS